jgi:hypothetical protein
MSKPYFKNRLTGNYGVLEGQSFSILPGGGRSSLLRLRLVRAVGGAVELGQDCESASMESLVQVSPEDVQRALLGI